MDLGGWLHSLGLERYEAAFRENDIDETVLASLTHETLKEIGVTTVGHRLKLLDAIAALRTDAGAKPPSADAASTSAAPSAPPEDRAERRQVTVMFSDLVGSTALSARMDPEDLREVISAYQKCVAETVQRFGGFVAKYMGDGVLVYFGYPQAHEDDAERAVRAGLELVQAISSLKTSAPLQTRVGIATGLVVVGDLIGSGSAHEQAVVGETPNLAARLQSIAKPNAVVIAESTRRLLGNLFELENLGAQDLKGIAGPVRAWAALRPSSVESRFEALRTATTPLVGRDEEIDLLTRRWEQAKAGDGCVALISGEPGIGKSRVVQTMQERLDGEPHTRLRFFCTPYHQDSALYPAITQLERAARFQRDDNTKQRLDKLETVLLQATNDITETAPLLADLLSIPTGDRYPVLDFTPQKRKEKTLAALVAQVEGRSGREPLLMVFEDVHWSDPTTRELLDLLIDRVPTLRVLVIITFRPEFTPPWVGRPHVTLLSLSRLPPRQRAEMIAQITGAKALPREIVDQIVDRTDGVPLFIEELTKSVVESGMVAEAGDHYAMAQPAVPLTIPTTLQASLLARLDRLAPTREVAQIGAALGRSFSHDLISAVAQMPQPRIDDALEQLVSAELIFRRGTAPDAEYTFKHALVQDAAYSTLLRNRRQQFHARIASTLESRFPELAAAQPQLMAQHCGEAGLNEKAVGYWLKAGQRAVARSAMVEAVAQLQKGLELLARQPDTASRQQQELDLQATLGSALIATMGYSAPEVGEVLARASAIAEQINRVEYVLPLIYGQFLLHLVRAEYELALAFAERMERVGNALGKTETVLLSRHCRGIVHVMVGEFDVARTLFEQCHGLGEPAYRKASLAMTSEDSYALMLGWSAANLAYLGYFDQARLRADQMLVEARALQHTYTLAICLLYPLLIAGLANQPNEVRRYAQEMIDLANEHGFPWILCLGTHNLGSSTVALGQPREGLSLVTKSVAIARSIGARAGESGRLGGQAEAYAALGQPRDGLNLLREGARIIEETDERMYEAEHYRVEGNFLYAIGDQAAAEQSYRRAIAVAERQHAKAFELRAATSLAYLWRDQGKRVEAHDLLAPIYGWFTEGFDTPVLQDAKALIEELN
jgi:class 3 adenylate cyclase/tetratricopeptide (TPR) repeat protein